MQIANSLEKTLMLGEIEGKKRRKRAAEDEMGWMASSTHHRQEFEQTLGDSEGHRNLVCCSQWGCKESDTT